MRISRRTFLKSSGASAAALAAGSVTWLGAHPAKAAPNSPELHVLNRATWGITPADIAEIQARGIEGWLDWQLDFENIADPEVGKYLQRKPILNSDARGIARAIDRDYGSVHEALLWGRVHRAAFSTRQLYERAVEFWTDHFNIPSPDLLMEKILDDRDVIRKHALGNFRDLLLASAMSPAMLIYLDNIFSSAENPNENYARELMELHTLGVDGGYTEQDVKNVARALTGWGIRDGWPGRFYFDLNVHDYGEKSVLGRTFPADRGIEEGLELLDFLALHPSTARHLATKLLKFFVTDEPPQSFIESTAQAYLVAEGDIGATIRHIFTSAEFYQFTGAKYRRPLDIMVASIRVLSPALDVSDPEWILWELNPLGQMPFHWYPPDGYPLAAAPWLNSGALLARWNFAFNMARSDEGWYEGVSFNRDLFIPDALTVGEWVDGAAAQILGAPLAGADRDAVIAFVGDDNGPDFEIWDEWREWKTSSLIGLLLSSPYFQWI
ncbi:MAG: DUF1800 domain-containing protein [Chloroflexi bacterium]|nr:DUF1800 domain-containing protein [Chloroflexota bacterium]